MVIFITDDTYEGMIIEKKYVLFCKKIIKLKL